jgi:hypothetical protein
MEQHGVLDLHRERVTELESRWEALSSGVYVCARVCRRGRLTLTRSARQTPKSGATSRCRRQQMIFSCTGKPALWASAYKRRLLADCRAQSMQHFPSAANWCYVLAAGEIAHRICFWLLRFPRPTRTSSGSARSPSEVAVGVTCCELMLLFLQLSRLRWRLHW